MSALRIVRLILQIPSLTQRTHCDSAIVTSVVSVCGAIFWVYPKPSAVGLLMADALAQIVQNTRLMI